MSLRAITSIAIALLLGLIAVLLVRGVLTSHRPSAASAGPTNVTPVVVAALPIERGAAMKPEMLKVVDYPNTAVPPGAFKTVAEAAGGPNSRVALRALAPNEPVMADKLSGAGGKANLSVTLTPGMRAVSIRSDDVSGVAGFVLPGDRVDILLTRSVGGAPITQVLAENAQVVGVDQQSDTQADKPMVAKAVTVEVSPEQAQIISLAHAIGSISFTLRQISDQSPLGRKVTTVAQLGGPGLHAAVRPRPRAQPRLMQVKVTRGVLTTDYPVGGN